MKHGNIIFKSHSDISNIFSYLLLSVYSANNWCVIPFSVPMVWTQLVQFKTRMLLYSSRTSIPLHIKDQDHTLFHSAVLGESTCADFYLAGPTMRFNKSLSTDIFPELLKLDPLFLYISRVMLKTSK